MKEKIFLGKAFIGLILLHLLSCSSEPFNLSLPLDHPAHPDAIQSSYSPPGDELEDETSFSDVQPQKQTSHHQYERHDSEYHQHQGPNSHGEHP